MNYRTAAISNMLDNHKENKFTRKDQNCSLSALCTWICSSTGIFKIEIKNTIWNIGRNVNIWLRRKVDLFEGSFM